MDATAGESFAQVVRPITLNEVDTVQVAGEICFACLEPCHSTIGFQCPRLETTDTNAALELNRSKTVFMSSNDDRPRGERATRPDPLKM